MIPERRRKSTRLKGYDYSLAGMCFITLVAHQRRNLFGQLVAGAMVLNDYGCILQAVWEELPRHYPHLELGAACVMPNHFHAILCLVDQGGRGPFH